MHSNKGAAKNFKVKIFPTVYYGAIKILYRLIFIVLRQKFPSNLPLLFEKYRIIKE